MPDRGLAAALAGALGGAVSVQDRRRERGEELADQQARQKQLMERIQLEFQLRQQLADVDRKVGREDEDRLREQGLRDQLLSVLGRMPPAARGPVEESFGLRGGTAEGATAEDLAQIISRLQSVGTGVDMAQAKQETRETRDFQSRLDPLRQQESDALVTSRVASAAASHSLARNRNEPEPDTPKAPLTPSQFFSRVDTEMKRIIREVEEDPEVKRDKAAGGDGPVDLTNKAREAALLAIASQLLGGRPVPDFDGEVDLYNKINEILSGKDLANVRTVLSGGASELGLQARE